MTEVSCRSIRFRGRSFDALALEPDAPLSAWIDRLDVYIAQFPFFFARKSIVIDVSNLQLDRRGAIELVKDLTGRGIRVLGLAGADPAWTSEELPPILRSRSPNIAAIPPPLCPAFCSPPTAQKSSRPPRIHQPQRTAKAARC